jgi:predicted amidohydrolase YtcJ
MNSSKLVLACIVGAACCASELGANGQPAELVLRGGAVFTADEARPSASAVAVRGGRIVYVGTDEGVVQFVGPATRTIEIDSGMVLPGFHDSHVHIVAGGLGLASCDLSGDDSAAAVAAHIADCASDNASSAWVTGRGWQLGVFPNANPTRAQLDALVPDRPAFFMAADGHSAWVNSRALVAAEVTAATPQPPGGRIERDPATNEPTGTLREAAVILVARQVPPPSHADMKAAILRSIALANSFGITSVHDANVPAVMLEPYLALDRDRALNARVSLAAQFNLLLSDVSAVPAEVERIARLRQQYRGARLAITAAKLGVDGALEAHTAALLEPYAGGEDRGPTMMQPDVVRAAVLALDRAGIQTHIHSIGDRAARMALDAVADARAANPSGPTHQMAHLQLVHPADIPRFAPLRIAANIQGLWAYHDEETVELVDPLLGPERAGRLYPYGSLERAGATLVGGSDWSVTSMNPLPAIEIATTRRGARQPAGPAWLPNEVVGSRDAMLLAYTINGARLQLHEEEVGSIALGKAADLVVLDKNLLAIPAVDINTARVRYTFVDGIQVHPLPEGRPQ